jgi:hypothetical protein
VRETTRYVVAEAEAARAKYGDFTSTHEALGVLEEERDELRAAIHENKLAAIQREAIQVAAVALRLADVCQRAIDGEAPVFRDRSGA